MTISEKQNEDSLILSVEGKIDTLTSPEFQTVLLNSFQKSTNLVVDMKDVTYMSSAGLRAMILGQKTAGSKGGKLTITNVSETVMDVFRMTGFDKILNIG